MYAAHLCILVVGDVDYPVHVVERGPVVVVVDGGRAHRPAGHNCGSILNFKKRFIQYSIFCLRNCFYRGL